MKKLFFIIIGLCALTLTACEKESIDLSLVSAEVELECIAEEYNTPFSSDTSHTFLCSGKVGGFTGLALIEVRGVDGLFGEQEIVVAGSETSFSFTFTDSCDEDYDGTPQTFTVTIYADEDKDGHVSQYGGSQRVFESSVVIIL